MPSGRSAGLLPRAILLVVFTFSGASGLVYEVLWMRRLSHIFGSTTLAVSTVLAAFMGGLAAGSYLLGAWADRNRGRALRAYGVLELAIAGLGLVVPLLLRGVESVYLRVAPALETVPTAFFVVQFVLAGIVLAAPCVLMGGTLPVLARWLVVREDQIGARIGTLYAANTFGACLGTAAATYVLLPHLGVRRGELVAVAANVLAGVAGLALARRWRAAEPAAGAGGPESAESASRSHPGDRLILSATALAGFAVMVHEVAWARLVALVFGSSVYAFGLILLLFLAGMAAGSAVFARLRAAPQRVLGLALLGSTLAALAGIAAVPHMGHWYMRGFPAVRDAFTFQHLLQILETAPLLLPLALLSGAAFPAAVAAVSDLAGTGRGVGRVTLWNTAGTVAGAFLGGFVLVPRLGLRATLTTAAFATAVGGALALRRAGTPRWARAGALAAAGLAAAALLIPAWPLDRLTQGAGFYAGIYGTQEGLRDAERNSELLFYKDGISTTLSVDRQGTHRFYRSNGKTDASTDPGDMANQLLLGHLPMLIHPDPRDVFVLGLGTGVSAAAIARYPVGKIVIADIESASREATKLFEPENRGVLSDPRVRFLVADGRNALLARKDTYDVILSDPSDVWVAGVGNLFTKEFYSLARTRLRPGGVMVQWFHGHSLPPGQMKLIVATFRSVFPHTSLWRPNRGDVILTGTVEPTPWDLERISRKVETVPGVKDDMLSMGFWHPLSIFSAFVLDGADLDRMLSGVEGLHTDDLPVVEYLAPRAGYDDTSSVNDAGVQALQTKTFPAIAGFDEARDLDARAAYLLGFAYASIGRTDPAIAWMERSVQGGARDPKFHVGLGNQYRLKDDTARAAAAYARALEIAPQDAEAALRLAEIRAAAGDDAAAEAVLRTALARSPADGDLAAAAGRFLAERGRAADALPLLEPALAAAPSNAALQLLAGRARAAAGKGGEASAALRQAAALAPADAALQLEAAHALWQIGDLEGAASAFGFAAALDPESVEARVGLVRVAEQRGDRAAAESARRQILELDPYNPVALGR